jgi:DNA-binding CsgD family transcriptional regulator
MPEMMDIVNPFADYGKIVHGERFIGRASQLRQIQTRVVQSPGGNLSLVGQRRVGKSSLAYQAIMITREALIQEKILPIVVPLSTYNSAREFFCDLINICFRKLQDLGWGSRRIREANDDVAERGIEQFKFSNVNDFFKETFDAGIRIIFILDEFDMSVRLCADDATFFDKIRDLGYRGRTTLLTISRASLPSLEIQAEVSSTLVGTVHELYLGMFDQSEIEDHFDRLAGCGIDLSGDERTRIREHCGGHPFLHDTVAFEIVEIFRYERKILLDEAFRRSQRVFVREFDTVVRNLNARKLLEPLMHILFASGKNVRSEDLNELQSYGIIRPANSGYSAFSTSFQQHLRQGLPVLIEDLTPTERRVLFCLSSDMANKEIGNELNIAGSTIKTHISNIFRKLEVTNRHEAVRRAREIGVID